MNKISKNINNFNKNLETTLKIKELKEIRFADNDTTDQFERLIIFCRV